METPHQLLPLRRAPLTSDFKCWDVLHCIGTNSATHKACVSLPGRQFQSWICVPCSSPPFQPQTYFFQTSLCLSGARWMGLFFHFAMLQILGPSFAVSLARDIHQCILLLEFWNTSRTLGVSWLKHCLHCWHFTRNRPRAFSPGSSAAQFSRAGRHVHLFKFQPLIYS